MILHRSQRGIAMILTLLAVLVLSSAGLTLVRTAATFTLESRQSLFETRARMTANDLRAVLVGWVAEHARSPRTDPNSLDAAPLNIAVDGYEVRVEPIDLGGCLHARWLAHAPSIASSLPVEFRRVSVPAEFAALDWKTAEPHERPTLEELLPRSARLVWKAPTGANTSNGLCHWVTTAGDGVLNIQSAPIDLLSSALAAAGVRPPDIRSILESRRAHTPIDPGAAARAIAAAAQRVDRHSGDAVPLTLRAGPWGFLVTVSQDHQKARWWAQVEETHTKAPAARRIQWAVTQFRRVP